MMKSGKSNWGALLALVTVAMMLMAGCGSSAPAAKQENKKVSLAVLKLTSSAPLFIGMDKGFFKEQGLELDPQWFEAAHPIAVATASGKVDVGATGITASLFNMASAGQKISIVADKGREQKGYPSSALLVTKKMWDEGKTKLEDLKGKRVGITQKGSTFHYMLGRLLESKGLSLNDVEIVPLTKVSALMAALESGQVDAVILNEPNVTRVATAGYGKVVASVGDVMEYQTSGIFFSPEMMKDKDKAVRFLKAYVKSTRYYYDAVLAGKNGKEAEEVIGIIAKYTGAPAAEVKQGLPYIDRDGVLLERDIATQINWYAQNQLIEKPLDPKAVTDTALLTQAIKELDKK